MFSEYEGVSTYISPANSIAIPSLELCRRNTIIVSTILLLAQTHDMSLRGYSIALS